MLPSHTINVAGRNGLLLLKEIPTEILERVLIEHVEWRDRAWPNSRRHLRQVSAECNVS
jgi:hypothetical protein